MKIDETKGTNNAKKKHTNTRANDAFIMIRIHTDVVEFQFKCKVTEFAMFQFILVKVRPAPDASIDNMRKTFAASDLIWE